MELVMFEKTVFFILLFVQCGLVSWYLPSLFYKRMRRVITEYPPAEYPLLYPKPEEEYHKFHHKFRLGNRILFCLSLAVVILVMLEGVNLEEGIWSMLPWAMFMIQMIPVMIIEVSEYSHTRLIREKNKSTVRVAGMQSRSLSELISPPLFLVWLGVQLACLFAIGWADDFQFIIGDSAFWSVLILLLANIAGVFYLRKLVSGKLMDPHLDPSDKFRASKAVSKSMLYVSMGVSLFSAAMRLINVYDADQLEPILMCIYCQLIVLVSVPPTLNATKLEDINFDVYRQS